MQGWHYHSHCMHHCEKLGGRSPPVRTLQEWQNLYEEIQHIKVDHPMLPDMLWLSATEGDKDLNLSRLDHWPKSFEATEGALRDFYSGELLDNYTRPWCSAIKDDEVGDTFNCIQHANASDTGCSVDNAWLEWQCEQRDMGCICSYQTSPMLHLRGFCPDTNIEDIRYIPLQLQDGSNNIIMIGPESAALHR